MPSNTVNNRTGQSRQPGSTQRNTQLFDPTPPRRLGGSRRDQYQLSGHPSDARYQRQSRFKSHYDQRHSRGCEHPLDTTATTQLSNHAQHSTTPQTPTPFYQMAYVALNNSVQLVRLPFPSGNDTLTSDPPRHRSSRGLFDPTKLNGCRSTLTLLPSQQQRTNRRFWPAYRSHDRTVSPIV